MLMLGQVFIRGEPVRSFPACFLAKDCAQLLQATIDRAEAQLTGAAAFLRRIENIVICAVDFMGACRDIAPAGCISPEAVNIHMPEIETRLSIDDPFREHLANAACTRDAMGAKTTCRPESSHIGRLAQDKFSIRSKRLKSVDQFDQLDTLDGWNALYASLKQTIKTRRIILQHCRI